MVGRFWGREEGEEGNFDGWNISEIPCSAAAAVDRERSSQQVFFSSSPECSSHFSILLSNHLFSPFLKVGHTSSGRTNEEEGTSK